MVTGGSTMARRRSGGGNRCTTIEIPQNRHGDGSLGKIEQVDFQ